MLAIRSHANADLFNWPDANLKHLGRNLLVFVRHEFIICLKIFEYVEDLLNCSTSRNFLAPAVNFVIFMAQRQLANIAVLGVRAKLSKILSDSVGKC